MKTLPAYLLAACMMLWSGLARATASDVGSSGDLSGMVRSAASPLAAAKIYAYQIADLTLRTAVSGADGSFRLDGLPAGLYKLIAFKPGFVPAVVMLTRPRGIDRQTLDLELQREAAAAGTEVDFWAIRRQIPSDVLRDIEGLLATAERSAAPFDVLPPIALATEIGAVTGVDDAAAGASDVSGGRIGVEGRVRDVEFDVSGKFMELAAADAVLATTGKAQAVSLSVQRPGASHVQVTTLNNSMAGSPAGPVDFERYRVSWSHDLGRDRRSDFSAQYTSESNFYRRGMLLADGLPEASTAWDVEGTYTTPVTSRSTLQAGVRYRDLAIQNLDLNRPNLWDLPTETLDLFGRGGLQASPRVVVEYGLYSTLRDGALSLFPQGGVVLRLGENWRASTSLTHKVSDEASAVPRDFVPVVFNREEACQQGETYCYRIVVSRDWGEGEGISFGAAHRKIDDALKLYFNENFFDHLESLHLVPGDELPELQFSLRRRLGPNVLAKFESHAGSGGGGLLHAGGNSFFDNEVSYLVTSMDTRFERSSTGVFIMFHQLEQRLRPADDSLATADSVEIERLEVRLNQDLDFWHWLSSDLAVQLNMELSRGGYESPDRDEVRKRITGGFAVKF